MDMKAALEELGWSQAEFARRFRLTDAAVSRWGRDGLPGYAEAFLESQLLIVRTGRGLVEPMMQAKGAPRGRPFERKW